MLAVGRLIGISEVTFLNRLQLHRCFVSIPMQKAVVHTMFSSVVFVEY